jgi:hypothetical protein
LIIPGKPAGLQGRIATSCAIRYRSAAPGHRSMKTARILQKSSTDTLRDLNDDWRKPRNVADHTEKHR